MSTKTSLPSCILGIVLAGHASAELLCAQIAYEGEHMAHIALEAEGGNFESLAYAINTEHASGKRVMMVSNFPLNKELLRMVISACPHIEVFSFDEIPSPIKGIFKAKGCKVHAVEPDRPVFRRKAFIQNRMRDFVQELAIAAGVQAKALQPTG